MKKNIALIAIAAAALLAVPAITRAQDAATNSPDATAPVHKKHGLPFHGKIAAIDATAVTVTVGTQDLQHHLGNQNHEGWQAGHAGGFRRGRHGERLRFKKNGDKMNATVLHSRQEKEGRIKPAENSQRKADGNVRLFLFFAPPARHALGLLRGFGRGILADEQLAAGAGQRHDEFIVAQKTFAGFFASACPSASLVACEISGTTRFGGVSGVCTCAMTTSSTVGASNGTWPVMA